VVKKIIYKVLKNYCWLALLFYFRRWQINKHSPIPQGPVIFVCTHQNAFLDAVVMACSMRRDPWFITRANVFKKPLVKKILNILQMIPVYRFRDGFSTLRKNDETIETCVNLLTRGKCILIFGEGNHNDCWFLRPLQKGFARMAIAAEERHDWKLGVKIVPVGIQYDSHNAFRSRVLVNFGKPILVNDYCSAFNATQQNLEALINKTAEEMKQLILNIPAEDYETYVAYFKKHRVINNDLVEQLESDQLIIKNYPNEKTLLRTEKVVLSKWLNPFFTYQFVNHLIPFAIMQWVLKTKVSDPQFVGSLKFSLGMILMPLTYFIQTALCYFLSGSVFVAGIYFLSLPISVLLRRA